MIHYALNPGTQI